MLETITITLLLIAIIVLQFYLSNQKNKWLGLILPSISLIISDLFLFGVSGLYIIFIPTLVLLGLYALFCLKQNIKIGDRWFGLILPLIPPIVAVLFNGGLGAVKMGFIIWFIPTLIFIGIYLICRSQLNKNKELEKMAIRDL